jgi:hypothetical protein
VIVAVPAVRVVQVAVDEIIDMVAVRNGGMSAVRSVNVAGWVAAATVRGGAGSRMGAIHRQFVLFDRSVGTGVVQVPCVQVVEMAIVLDGSVSAIGTVLVRMIGVCGGGHGMFLSGENEWDGPTRFRVSQDRE